MWATTIESIADVGEGDIDIDELSDEFLNKCIKEAHKRGIVNNNPEFLDDLRDIRTEILSLIESEEK